MRISDWSSDVCSSDLRRLQRRRRERPDRAQQIPGKAGEEPGAQPFAEQPAGGEGGAAGDAVRVPGPCRSAGEPERKGGQQGAAGGKAGGGAGRRAHARRGRPKKGEASTVERTG